MQRLRSIPALVWALEKAGMRQPFVILALVRGHPRMHGLSSDSAHLWALAQEQVTAPTSDVVPAFWGLHGMQGLHSASTLLWAPEK